MWIKVAKLASIQLQLVVSKSDKILFALAFIDNIIMGGEVGKSTVRKAQKLQLIKLMEKKFTKRNVLFVMVVMVKRVYQAPAIFQQHKLVPTLLKV